MLITVLLLTAIQLAYLLQEMSFRFLEKALGESLEEPTSPSQYLWSLFANCFWLATSQTNLVNSALSFSFYILLYCFFGLLDLRLRGPPAAEINWYILFLPACLFVFWLPVVLYVVWRSRTDSTFMDTLNINTRSHASFYEAEVPVERSPLLPEPPSQPFHSPLWWSLSFISIVIAFHLLFVLVLLVVVAFAI